jgi:hypothetical protein
MAQKTTTIAGCLALALLTGIGVAQQPASTLPTDQEEEQLDTAMRKFGYVSGQAFQCHTKEEQAKAERVALDVATNLLRLFGSDRAFFYAAAFGAGASERMDQKACPGAIKEAAAMIGKLKVLSTR